MRIGVVSDTHNSLRNVERIVELFNAAGVAQVFHTGDITQAKTLVVLARLAAPLAGVYGNNDQERDALEQAARDHGMALVHGALSLSVASRRIAVVHDPREIDAKLAAAHDLVLHGHTHRLTLERRAGALIFNPGECAGFLPGHNAVGVVDLDKFEVELLRF